MSQATASPIGGNVEHPGIFSTKYFVTASEAVALAGGLNKFASPRRMVVIRQEPNQPMRRVPLDFLRIGGGDHPEENIVLLAGDTLFVP